MNIFFLAVATWFHMMNGHIDAESLTEDFAAMHAAGIDEVTIFNAGRPFDGGFKMKQVAPENVKTFDESKWPQVKFMSEEYFSLFRHALDEAAKYGMTVGAANCDGWSESGGPWITPEMSMKELIWRVSLRGNAEERRNGEEVGTGGWRTVGGAESKIRAGYYVKIAEVECNGRTYEFGYTTNGKTNHPASPEGKGLECDKMDAAALELHFANYPAAVLKAAGEHV